MLMCAFSVRREWQEGDRKTRSWRRIRFPHSRFQARRSFCDRARHARGVFRSRGWRHHHVGERQKRDGRHAFGGRETGALRHGRPGAGSREDLQRVGTACRAHRSQGDRRGASLLGIFVEKIQVVERGQMGSKVVRASSRQLSVLLQDWRGEQNLLYFDPFGSVWLPTIFQSKINLKLFYSSIINTPFLQNCLFIFFPKIIHFVVQNKYLFWNTHAVLSFSKKWVES